MLCAVSAKLLKQSKQTVVYLAAAAATAAAAVSVAEVVAVERTISSMALFFCNVLPPQITALHYCEYNTTE